MKKLTIEIIFDQKTETYTLTDDMGNKKVLRCLYLVGHDFQSQDFYMFGGGKASELAHAFGEGLAQGLHQDQFRGDDWYLKFYQALLKEMMLRTKVRAENEITAEEALERFESDKCHCQGNCTCKKIYH